MSLTHLALFILTAISSALLTRWVRNFALACGWCQLPRSERHIHHKAIPRIGGVAIYLCFVTVTMGFWGLGTWLAFPIGISLRHVLVLLVPATVPFLLGLYDDFRPLPAAVKFAVQGIAAVLLFVCGYRVTHIQLLFGSEALGTATGVVLTIVWVLWVTNAFNLLDGLDGLAAGSALFSSLVVLVVSLVSGEFGIATLTLILAATLLGFLRYNFNPATVFLGDCGSLFIGFLLSAIALAGMQKTPTAIAIAIPIVSFGLPVLETALSIVRRFLSGRPLFSADREHIHHKLLQRGYSHRQAVVLLYAVSALFGFLSLAFLYPNGRAIAIVLAVIGVGIWVAVQHLGYHEFFEVQRVAKRALEQKRIIVNNLAIRRATEALASSKSLPSICQILRSTFEDNEFDGFELRLNVPAYAIADGDDLFRVEQDGSSSYSWRNEQAYGELRPVWTLSIALVSANGQRHGQFTVFRALAERELLADVNLFTTSGFHIALANAVERTSIPRAAAAAASAFCSAVATSASD